VSRGRKLETGNWKLALSFEFPFSSFQFRLFYQFRQRRPFHEFHHQGADAARFFQAVNCRDVRVVERSQHLRFAAKARQAFRVVAELSGQNLERHVAIQLGVAGAIDFAHATRAKFPQNAVVRDDGPGFQSVLAQSKYRRVVGQFFCRDFDRRSFDKAPRRRVARQQ
jgi:hypothetical protein